MYILNILPGLYDPLNSYAKTFH